MQKSMFVMISSFPGNSVLFFSLYPRLAGEFSSEKGHTFVDQLHKVSINDNLHSSAIKT